MSVTLQNLRYEMLGLTLDHDFYCTAVGKCSCREIVEILEERIDATLAYGKREVVRKVPDTLLIPSREKMRGLPDAILSVPSVKAAIRAQANPPLVAIQEDAAPAAERAPKAKKE